MNPRTTGTDLFIHLLNLSICFMSNTYILLQGVGKTLTAGSYCKQLNIPDLD